MCRVVLPQACVAFLVLLELQMMNLFWAANLHRTTGLVVGDALTANALLGSQLLCFITLLEVPYYCLTLVPSFSFLSSQYLPRTNIRLISRLPPSYGICSKYALEYSMVVDTRYTLSTSLACWSQSTWGQMLEDPNLLRMFKVCDMNLISSLNPSKRSDSSPLKPLHTPSPRPRVKSLWALWLLVLWAPCDPHSASFQMFFVISHNHLTVVNGGESIKTLAWAKEEARILKGRRREDSREKTKGNIKFHPSCSQSMLSTCLRVVTVQFSIDPTLPVFHTHHPTAPVTICDLPASASVLEQSFPQVQYDLELTAKPPSKDQGRFASKSEGKVTQGIACLAVLFLGYAPAILIMVIFGAMMLWVYGSFWITGALVIIGGSLFTLNHTRLAILVTTVYSMYCAKIRIGWLGLVLCMNLAFISNDILIHLLKGNVNENESKCVDDQSDETKGKARNFCNGSGSTGPNGEEARVPKGRPSGESSQTAKFVEIHGESSSSGLAEADTSSAQEVLRILHSSDHYAALGLSRNGDIDVAVLKREYRKKAMLVHPDKNMGNAMAVESFKKLQSAYEVLLDSSKKSIYDEELRREELTKSFQRFQSDTQKDLSELYERQGIREHGIIILLSCRSSMKVFYYSFSSQTSKKGPRMHACNFNLHMNPAEQLSMTTQDIYDYVLPGYTALKLNMFVKYPKICYKFWCSIGRATQSVINQSAEEFHFLEFCHLIEPSILLRWYLLPHCVPEWHCCSLGDHYSIEARNQEGGSFPVHN
eukprot:Gb_02690 [translate_table: standard]